MPSGPSAWTAVGDSRQKCESAPAMVVPYGLSVWAQKSGAGSTKRSVDDSPDSDKRPPRQVVRRPGSGCAQEHRLLLAKGGVKITLCIAAKFKDGVLCVSDSAVSVGHNRLTKPDIKGRWWGDQFIMFSGTLYYAQEVFHREEKGLRDAILAVKKEHADDEDDDSCELLSVDKHTLEITYFESTGAVMGAGDYGAIGHGSSLGLAMLEMVYAPGRSEAWLRKHLDNIIRIVEKYDVTVFRPSRFEVIGRASE